MVVVLGTDVDDDDDDGDYDHADDDIKSSFIFAVVILLISLSLSLSLSLSKSSYNAVMNENKQNNDMTLQVSVAKRLLVKGCHVRCFILNGSFGYINAHCVT